jgi:hypothetical protein
MNYEDFIASKRGEFGSYGIDDPEPVNPLLFEFQKDVTRWSLVKGRAACWLDTGLGKSWVALQWANQVARHTGKPVLIMTPLAVSQQFVREGAKLVLDVNVCLSHDDVTEGINVINYERLHLIDATAFGGVVLDESSILKSSDGKTRSKLIDMFSRTPFRLACSATPAPNDHTEIGNHAEFLGVCTRAEMLSTYFVHDGGSTQDWRLKGHAKDDFWRWVSSWAVNIRKPSDVGYADDGYILPPLRMHDVVVQGDIEMARRSGLLFDYQAKTLTEQRAARRGSIPDRVAACAELVNGNNDAWLVWCDLNDESAALTSAIDGAVEVTGSMPTDEKERRIMSFIDGGARVLVSKPSICGAGLNMQRCHNTAFVGLSHSWEAWYQAIRRIYRFGQTSPVDCYMITSSIEGAVVESLRRKQADADAMNAGMVEHMRDAMRRNLKATMRETLSYEPTVEMLVPAWVRTESEAA